MHSKELFVYLKKSFVTGAAKNFAVILSTLIFLPLTIQKIGLEVYGLVVMPLIFGGVIAFADFGVSKSVTFLIAGRSDDGEIGEVITSGAFVNGIVISLLAIAAWILIVLKVPIFGESLNIEDSLRSHVIIVGFSILVVMLINNLFAAILEAFFLQHYINMGFAISSVAVNTFIYGASLVTDSVPVLMISPLFAFILMTIYYLYIITSRTAAALGRASYMETLKLATLSLDFFKISAVNTLVLPANKFLLVYLSGSTGALAVLDISMKIAMMSSAMLNTLSQPLFAVFSNNSLGRDQIGKYAICVTTILFSAYLVGVAIYFSVGAKIVSYLDRENASVLFDMSIALMIGLGLHACSEPCFRAMLGVGDLGVALRLKLLTPILNILILAVMLSDQTLASIVYSYAAAVFLAGVFIILYFAIFFERRMNRSL